MSERAPTPRTKADILYQEVLGEIGPLLTRVETAIAAAESLHATCRSLPENLRRVAAEINASASVDAQRSLARGTQELAAAAQALQTTATTARQAAQRHAWLTIGLALAAGFLGGALAGLAVGALLFPIF